ncbi:hypothetical protein C0583_02955 [Candidatus Parcubacteria bacterium]|nr:MAG: hypothetical protein C0583_02955 [Candidatus Parcubacteria bacterium]
MQHFLSIYSLLAAIIALFFGVLVINKNKRNIVNQTLFLLTLATFIWMIAYWRWLSVYNDYSSALFWARFLGIGSTLIPIFYFHWIVSLLELNKKLKKFLIFCYVLVIPFEFLSFSPYMVKTVEPYKGVFSFWPKAGFLYSFYLFFFFFGLTFYALTLLVSAYRKSNNLKREQIKYVILGTVLGFGGGATNFFLWYDIDILPYGHVFVVLYPVVFVYSIIKHRLMDIKFVMRRYSVLLGSIIILLVPAFIIKYYDSIFLSGYSLFIDLALIAVAISVYPSVRKWSFRVANKYFFSSLYDSSKVIANISERLRSTLDINQIYEYIHKAIDGAMHVKSFGVLTYEEDKKHFSTKYNVNFNIGRRVNFPENEYMNEMFVKNNQPIVVSEFKALYSNKKTKETIELLESFHVDVMCPLIVKNKIVGLLVLGQKESGDMYNDEDLQVLSIISAQSAIAIENAMLYEETRSFGERMEAEVKKATKDLRLANERLKKLDAAKSEFISIASHQLRTPLTVIKGYISMMLEGSFGEFPDISRDSLEKVFESNERLISLVENLLNISRIESGRLKFTYTEIQLEKMIESVIWEIKRNAEDKGIKLEFKKPNIPLSKVMIDEEKIRQVVMNLIDNAVKYTNKGRVVVTLKEKDNALVFSVKDNGIGISKDDMPNMFKKFSRGTTASLEHTEGTGLGLLVAKQMIEYHDGKIWAESEGEDKGTTFTFVLPIKERKTEV